MDDRLKFIGLTDPEEVKMTVETTYPWQPKAFIYPPFGVIKPFPDYMTTVGSGNLSMGTIAYGFQYVSAIDVFRHNFDSLNPDEPIINIDHYIAGSISPNHFAVFLTPPQSYHWPKPMEEPISYTHPRWQVTINNMLQKGKLEITS